MCPIYKKGERELIENYRPITLLNSDYKISEATEQNGLLIALDQEKAYGKITHDYLLCTLETYNFLESFRKTVKFLYENAETSVMINRVLSKPFNVTRGVRQGDPSHASSSTS